LFAERCSGAAQHARAIQNLDDGYIRFFEDYVQGAKDSVRQKRIIGYESGQTLAFLYKGLESQHIDTSLSESQEHVS
jgi:hypothetical protein